MCVLMSMEHPKPLSQACSDDNPVITMHLRKLEWYYSLGLRRVQLSYNRRTMFADGCTERRDAGLSFYGVELIEKMNELGMLVDCAHTGIQSSIDAAEVSSKPIIFSHTACRGVYNHPRNKTDEALKVLAEKDGVACIHIVPSFLSYDSEKAGLSVALNHIDHAVKVMGVEHVGIGSDGPIRDRRRFPSDEAFWFSRAVKYQPSRHEQYKNFVNEVDLKPPRYMPELAHTDYMLQITNGLLSRGYSEEEVKGIIGENCVKLLKKVL